MRRYTDLAVDDPTIPSLLDVLSNIGSPIEAYRKAMKTLGNRLADAVFARVNHEQQKPTFCVVCTVEDADFLASGLLDRLLGLGVPAERVKLVCFWNERVRHFSNTIDNLFDIAPTVKSYQESMNIGESIIIMVKSIISSGCVVKNNLATLIDQTVPERILVASPVMVEHSQHKLEAEFPPNVAKRFEYVTFAIDNEVVNNLVVPGIGGSVYERLGFTDHHAYVPEIVRSRRAKFQFAYAQ